MFRELRSRAFCIENAPEKVPGERSETRLRSFQSQGAVHQWLKTPRHRLRKSFAALSDGFSRKTCLPDSGPWRQIRSMRNRLGGPAPAFQNGTVPAEQQTSAPGQFICQPQGIARRHDGKGRGKRVCVRCGGSECAGAYCAYGA